MLFQIENILIRSPTYAHHHRISDLERSEPLNAFRSRHYYLPSVSIPVIEHWEMCVCVCVCVFTACINNLLCCCLKQHRLGSRENPGSRHMGDKQTQFVRNTSDPWCVTAEFWNNILDLPDAAMENCKDYNSIRDRFFVFRWYCSRRKSSRFSL